MQNGRSRPTPEKPHGHAGLIVLERTQYEVASVAVLAGRPPKQSGAFPSSASHSVHGEFHAVVAAYQPRTARATASPISPVETARPSPAVRSGVRRPWSGDPVDGALDGLRLLLQLQ